MEKALLANRYRILKKLGEGGMGRIWKVHDTLENKELALKQYYRRDSDLSDSKTPIADRKRITLSTIASDSTESDLRFKQEFRTMVKLKHPNTVNVFDYGILENGDDYITMEIVSGGELSDIIKERQLTFSGIYRILIQICQVLNFIHSRLLVHRDIKPENIRITLDGNVKMMDFGLMDQMGLPSNGQITGTIAYLPPEVAQGGIIDARSDLYSLGCLAYELVAGHPPFTAAKIIEVIKKHISESPKLLQEVRPNCPKELEEIILKLLAKNQNDRYQSTSELLNDLVPLSGEKFTIENLEQRKSYLNCSELIGRDKEIQKLKDAFGLATQGKGQSIFIAAPAGVGKSRLLQEFKLKVQLAEIPYIEGQCFEQGMTPYQPLADAFRLLLPLAKKEAIDKYGQVLVKIIPELKEKGYKPAPALDDVAEKVRLFEQVSGWLKEISRTTPFVICIEDLHWADISSLKLLNACIRELRKYPVMILGAFRDDEVESTSAIFQTEEEELTHIMRLSTLNEDNVSSLIKGMLGRIEITDEFTGHIFTATAGNAFFVSETIRALIEEEQLKLERGCWILPADISTLELPTSIEATILRRLNLLGSEALELARTAAVVGRGLELSFLKSLSGLEDEKLFEILDELIERQFMRVEEKQYLFTHDRVRETLYAQLSQEEREKFHEQSGVILEERHVEDPNVIASGLAYHFSKGLNKQKAIKYLLIAGKIALGNNAVVEATKLLSQAVELLENRNIEYPDKETVLIKTRDSLLECSLFADPKLNTEICERQYQAILQLADVPRFIKILRFIFKIIDFLPQNIAFKIKAILNKPRPPKPKLKGDFNTLIAFLIRALGSAVSSNFFVGKTQKSYEAAEKCFEYLPDKNYIPFALITCGSVTLYIWTGKFSNILKKIKRSINILERLKDQLSPFEYWIYTVLIYQREYVPVITGRIYDKSFWERGVHLCEDKRMFDSELWLYYIPVEWSSYNGVLQEFRHYTEKAMELSKRIGRPIAIEVFLYIYMTRFFLLRKEYNEAEKWCNKLWSMSTQLSFSVLMNWARIYHGVILFEKGEKEKAISSLESAISVAKGQKYINLIDALYFLGGIYLNLGDVEKAQSLGIEALETNTKSFEKENVHSQVRIYRLLGEINQKKRKFEEAMNYLNKSLEIAEQIENPLEEGLSQFARGSLFVDLTQYNLAIQSFQKAQKKFLEIDCKNILIKLEKDIKKLKQKEER